MKLFTKELLYVLQDVRACKTAPDEYMLSQSKNNPHGAGALSPKLEAIEKFAAKIHGECHATSQPFIRGDEYRMTFYLVGDCVPMKEFDQRITKPSETMSQFLGRKLLPHM